MWCNCNLILIGCNVIHPRLVLARELKEENQGLIRDFKGLNDSIVVKQENDAQEIVELTKSFKELIADNEMLRRKNEQRQLELSTYDMQRFLFNVETPDLTDRPTTVVLNKSVSPLVSSEATLDQNIQTEGTQVCFFFLFKFVIFHSFIHSYLFAQSQCKM